MPLKIVVDSHIPFAVDVFSRFGDVLASPGHEIGPKTVRDADILIVRSVTIVDRSLLKHSSVSFVGSATAGIDHIDTEYLSERGVEFAYAPGANAESVVEYVIAALSTLSAERGEDFRKKTIGIVGCGNVGSRLADRCALFGMRVLQNDPPRALAEDRHSFSDLELLLSESDIVSVHTPLSETGPHPTKHLISARELYLLKKGAWVVHTARGGVCVEKDLVDARKREVVSALVLDVWENEPTPDPYSVSNADIATGHIAGYSRDAKRKGIEMVAQKVVSHFGLPEAGSFPGASAIESLQPIEPSLSDPVFVDALVSQMMNIRSDDERFRDAMKDVMKDAGRRGVAFHSYRANYPPRRGFSRFDSQGLDLPANLIAALSLRSSDSSD